ncbi:hypothetical protein SAMN05720764_10696 [Fibrobacter sp. UWH5]|uniref:poly(ethylene terephthalate) hydrolase family protein n=1 Tax=Fibrobacter sp. UWH5 TaxID=1896211 RepID=UPI00091FCD3B|nr:esterase [Fibrobacter sp. UWH5]SHK99963.1 hypothetical protein SAMN05720764_10696 [Fibrobacter sp. UWH5]
MKKNFIRVVKLAFVTASALAFMNCGDSVADAVDGALGGLSSSSVVGEPVIDPVTGEPMVDPVTGEIIYTNPESSAAMDPTDDPITGEENGDVGGEGEVVPPTGDTPAEGGDTPAEGGDVPAEGDVPTDNNPSDVVTSSDSEGGVTEPASSTSESAPESSSAVVQEAPKGIFLANDTDENKDYMEVEYFTNTGDNGGAILAYPKRLSETQKHGVVLWGPGGGSSPSQYEGIIRRLASHGFVVIATSESPDGTGRGKPALDWLEKKNNTPGDPLYQKLDMTKVGASGHSMGGLQSEEMLINDDRVITAVLNNSGDMAHVDGTKVPATKTFAIVYGEGGMERPNAEADYGNPGVKAPACLIKMTGGAVGANPECQNGECGWGHGSGPWGGMAATVSWMRWHLGGEDFRKADFVGTSGAYINGPIVGGPGNWKGQCKNF